MHDRDDGNPLNNEPTNLYWGTRRENVADSVRHGTHVAPPPKVTAEQVAEIRRAVPKERFNVFRDGKVHIMERRCKTCIWSPNSPLRARADEMHAETEPKLSAIICHSTLGTDENAACRGHLDNGCTVLQLAVRMGVVEWVRNVWDVPDLPE